MAHCHSSCACSTMHAAPYKPTTGRARLLCWIPTRRDFPPAACASRRVRFESTLLALGQRESAHALGRAFLAEHSSSPAAMRVRMLLENANGKRTETMIVSDSNGNHGNGAHRLP